MMGDYEQFGYEALLEGQRSGRPPRLRPAQQQQWEDIIDSGPQAYGFLSGVWKFTAALFCINGIVGSTGKPACDRSSDCMSLY